MVGHETGNGRIENLITTVLAIEIVGTAHLRDHIIDLLDQTVAGVRVEVTLMMRADVIVVLRQEIKLEMTVMIDLVAQIGHPTKIRKWKLANLVEMTINKSGPQKFIIGDVVQFKLDGSRMIVEGYDPSDAKVVLCMWRDRYKELELRGKYHEGMLDIESPAQFSIVTI